MENLSTKLGWLPKSILIEFNNASKREKRKRILMEEFIEEIPDDYECIIEYSLHHTKDEIRTRVVISKFFWSWLDISVARWELIPKLIVDEDNKYVFDENGLYKRESIEQAIEKFPYKERAWYLKAVETPYRGTQGAFRKKVLHAYENKCVVCNLSEKSLLRAAHIIDVANDGNDEIDNGLCLCVLHEVAYDKGILKIDEYGNIEFKDDTTKCINKKINYPADKNNYPNTEYLRWKYSQFE